jgi:hypothetical protein
MEPMGDDEDYQTFSIRFDHLDLGWSTSRAWNWDASQPPLSGSATIDTHVVGIVLNILKVADEVDLVASIEASPLDDFPANVDGDDYEDHTIYDT